MGNEVRYTMNHLGDIIVGGAEKVWHAIINSTQEIKNKYHIHTLERKKQLIIEELGVRLSEIKKTSPELEIFDDDILRDCFDKLSEVEKKIHKLFH